MNNAGIAQAKSVATPSAKAAGASPAPRSTHPFAAFGGPIVCRGCGRDDRHACIDPATGESCSWFLIDLAYPDGICSACAKRIAASRGWECFFGNAIAEAA